MRLFLHTWFFPQASQEERDAHRNTLKRWVLGYGKNSKSKAYILDEAMRVFLVPASPPTAAVEASVAAPLLADIRSRFREESVAEGVGELNLDREPMDMGTGESGKASIVDPGITSPSSVSSLPSFHGFPSPAKEGAPSSSVKAKSGSGSSSVKPKEAQKSKESHNPKVAPTKSESSSKSSSKSSRRRGKKTEDAPKEPVPGPSQPAPAFDYIRMSEILMSSLEAKIASLRTDLGNDIRKDLTFQMTSALSTASDNLQHTVHTALGQVQERQNAMATSLAAHDSALAQLAQHPAGPSFHPPASLQMPPQSLLPPMDPANPWRPAIHAPLQDGMLTIEGLGTRPVSDFERAPEGYDLPCCYVRLTQDALIRQDKVPKETVILPREKVQASLLKAMTAGACLNSKLLPHKGSYTTFTTPDPHGNPLSTKVLEATLKAVEEGKPCPSLRELEQPSLLLPGGQDCWKEVAATFSVGKLAPTCASEQFNEDLPSIPDSMLVNEFRARDRLMRTLSALASLELAMSQFPAMDLFKVVAKQLLPTFQQDLYDFFTFRMKCRKHVLGGAMVHHEPSRLIKGPLFGAGLFASEQVREAIEGAERANQSLRTRWGLAGKRKSVEGFGPQPKNRKRFKKSFKKSQVPQPSTSMQVHISPTSIGLPPSHPPIVGSLVSAPQPSPNFTQSPAFNPQHETTSFRGYGAQRRGGQVRGGRGGVRGRGGNQTRGRGYPGGRGGRAGGQHRQ